VLLLVYGYARIDDLAFAQRYLQWLSSQSDKAPERLAGLELAGAALLEVELPLLAPRQAQAKRLVEAMADEEMNAPAVLRSRAGNTLARLGDLRFDPEQWHLPAETLLGFVEIPAGLFWMGSSPEKDGNVYDDKQPQHEVRLPTFYVARYPVTIAQFHQFVEMCGYNFNRWDWNSVPNHPVVSNETSERIYLHRMTPPACCGAIPSTTIASTPVAPSASVTPQATGTPTSVSG
jgi:hypothetical protein